MSLNTAVLVATYNGVDYIKEQLLSILGQTLLNIDIYVRDDGSDDETMVIVNELAAMHSNIFVIKDVIKSGAPASNFFLMLSKIDLSKYSYVAFSDQDDIWMAHKLERGLAKLSSENSDGYSSDLFAFSNENNQTYLLKKSYSQRKYDFLFQGASAGCTYVISAKLAALVIKKIGNIDFSSFRRRSHDWLIYAIARAHNLDWYCDTYASIFYRQHPKNVYGAKNSIQGMIERLNLARSGWYRESILWNADFFDKEHDCLAIIERIRRFSFVDRFWLALNVRKFRRRFREQAQLAFVILLGLF